MLYFLEVYQGKIGVSRPMMLRVLFISLILFSSFGHARMYQWIEPDSGTTQLSGKPPAWYRSAEGGPRIFVFERGRIIDDTSIEVSNNQRELMRQNAFIKAEEDREAARAKLAKANKLKSKFDNKVEETPIQEESDEVVEIPEIPPPALVEGEETEESGEEDTILDEMRALITDWEMQQSKSARDLIEQIETPNSEPLPADQ
jgi:hypothetical protein